MYFNYFKVFDINFQHIKVHQIYTTTIRRNDGKEGSQLDATIKVY